MWQKFKSKVKKGRSGSLRSGCGQDQPMSDQKFRQCQSASALPRSGQEPKLTTTANFPAETAVSLNSLAVDLDVSAADNHIESEERRTALLDHLAQKYPTHADAIRSPGGWIYDSGTIRRRRIAPVMHGSQSSVHQMTDRMAASCCADAEAGSPVSSSGLGSCRELRSTLPVIRSPNKSMERPLGQVFLVYHGETKRAVLPNEVTSIDTVRALFVRSFPRSLSMRWFDSPYRKIYILDSATNVFYELEDLGEIKDRIVLKIFEHSECTALASPRALQQTRPVYDALIRATPHDSTTSVSSLGQSTNPCTSPLEGMEKTHSLPPSVSSLQMYSSQQSVSLPPQNPWSHIAPKCLSPSKGLPITQRHSVACLPEPVSSNSSSASHMSQSHSYQDYTDRDLPLSAYSSGTVTPSSGDSETRNRMQKMESQLASLTAWVQTAMYKQGKTGVAVGGDSRSSSIHRSAIISAPNSAKSSVSDISTCTPQPVVSVTMLNIMCVLRRQAQEVRSELCQLRRMQVAYTDCMRTAVQDVFQKIKIAMDNVPDLRALPGSWTRRLNSQVHMQNYNLSADQVNEGLRDLEKLVEEIRKDVVGRKCRVNMAEVESLALALSQISRSLADLKSGFPEVHDQMKSVMENEMEVVVHEEKFLREEPMRIEESLKRSKKLMGTLLTLKKLASVQEKRPVSIPTVVTKHELTNDDRQGVLLNIEAMIPNHEARMQCLEEAAAARERKKKITGNVESLRFEKALELAQRQLRETDNMARNAARQDQVLSLIYQQKTTPSDGGAASKDNAQNHASLHANQNSASVANGVDKHLPNGGFNTSDKVSGTSVLSICDVRSTEPTQSKKGSDGRLHGNVSDVLESMCSSEQSGKSEATKESSDKKIPLDLSLGAPSRKEDPMAVAFLVSPTAKSGGGETCERQKPTVSSLEAAETATDAKAITLSSATKPPVDVFSAPSPNDSIVSLLLPSSLNLSGTVAVSPSPTAKERVTFSRHVVEIPDCANDCPNRSKRVPPPPPPRKTTPSQGNGSGSTDIYENVDDCKGQGAAEPVASTRMVRPQSVFGLSRQAETVMFMKPRPISEYVQGGFQSPPSKLSSAATSPVCFTNGNRAISTKEPTPSAQVSSVADKLCCQKDSDSDSSTSADSQTGTIKRNPHTKDEVPGDKKQQAPAGSNGNVSRETCRIPPPVPLRKTSTLSTQNKMTSSPVAQHQYSNIQELRREHALLEKQQLQQSGDATRKTPRTAGSSLANGEIDHEAKLMRTNAGQNSQTERRKCEETEIY